MSIVSANGFAGTVANASTTPAATLSVSISGLLKGNGTAISAASAGTDYLAPSGNGSALTGLTYTQLPALSANSVLGALTATTGSSLALPSCSGATNALIWTSGTGFGCNTISVGTGTVTTTGSPSAGDIATFSSATAITNVAQTGSGSVVRATSPSISNLTVTGSFTATGLVTNADLVNAATTVNGQSCVLGAACTITASAGTVTVGTTTVAGGTTTRVLFDNSGILGEYSISGSGNVAMTTAPTIASPTITGAFTATGLVTNADLVSPSITVNGSTCTLGSSCTPIAGGLVVGSTAIGGGTTTRVLYDNAGALGEYTVSGSGNVAMTTSPVFTTPALGTPSAVNLSNATALPCAAMPALTGAVTSSSGSCATTSATQTDSKTITFDSTTAVTAQTISFPIEWTSYTITSVKSAVNGGGSFTANVKIGSTSATGCSAISVSGATNTNTTCTAANTGSANDIINVVLSSPSGTVNQAYVSVVFTHTVN